MLHLFALWIAIYVDDCYNIEPDGTAQSALGALNGLAKVPGLALAPDKQAGPTITALILGADISRTKTHSRRTTKTEGTSNYTRHRISAEKQLFVSIR